MPAPKGNQFALGNNGGRPPKFENVKELSKKIEEYFDYVLGDFKETNTEWTDDDGQKQMETSIICIREPEPLSVTGLALFIGFSDKSSLYDYKKNEEFSHSIKRALTMIEQHHEVNLFSKSPTGSIFALKNMGWTDKVEQVHTGGDKPVKIISLGNGEE